MISKIKYLIMGVVIGSIMSLGISYGDEAYYKLTKVSYPIYVDMKEVKLNSDVLNYNGTTYVPLRELATLTGDDVFWDTTNNVVLIKSAFKVVTHEKPIEIIKEVPKEVVKEKVVYVTPTPGPINSSQETNVQLVYLASQYMNAIKNSDMELVKIVKLLKNDKVLVQNSYGTEYILDPKTFFTLNCEEDEYYIGKINALSSKIIDKSGNLREFYTD